MANTITVRFYRDYTYDPTTLKDLPQGIAEFSTWDLASDRQRAEHAASWDFEGHFADLTPENFVQEIVENER